MIDLRLTPTGREKEREVEPVTAVCGTAIGGRCKRHGETLDRVLITSLLLLSHGSFALFLRKRRVKQDVELGHSRLRKSSR